MSNNDDSIGILDPPSWLSILKKKKSSRNNENYHNAGQNAYETQILKFLQFVIIFLKKNYFFGQTMNLMVAM